MPRGGGGAVMSVRILVGDALARLRELPAESVQCVVTSPPYWRQRDYGGGAGQIGMEDHPDGYVRRMVEAFRLVRTKMCPNSAMWLNIGEKWASGGNGGGGSLMAKGRDIAWAHAREARGWRKPPPGYKDKDMVGLPWALAHALRADGWWLRIAIVWDKIVAPEPLRADRPSMAHEYVFLFANSAHPRVSNPAEPWWGTSVWSMRHDHAKTGHPAVMPEELARRCVVCSTAEGETVMDPFAGSGTVGLVAAKMNRSAILIELNPEYAAMAERRIRPVSLFGKVTMVGARVIAGDRSPDACLAARLKMDITVEGEPAGRIPRPPLDIARSPA